MKKTFEYDKDTGVSTCSIVDKDKFAFGMAHCHEDDKEFQSQFTGGFIAEARALIDLQCQKRNDLKQQLKPLYHLRDCIKTSKHHNPKSYENRMLQRQISCIENQLHAVNEEIATERQYLKEYILNKDLIHAKFTKGQK